MSRSGRITAYRLAQFIEPNPSIILVRKINSLREKMTFTQVLNWIAVHRPKV
jgi:hypothetical protein